MVLFTSQKYKIFVFFIILFPLLLFFLLKNKELTVTFDSYAYLALADNLAQGHGFTLCNTPHIFHSPGFPLMMCAVKSITGFNMINSGHLLCSISLSITAFLMFWIGKKIFLSENIGMLSVYLFLLSGRVQKIAMVLKAENVLAPLYMGTFYLCFKMIQRGMSWSRVLVMTLLLIFAYYCKPEAIFIFPSCFIVIGVGRWIRNKNWKEIYLYLIVSSILFILAIVPNILRIKHETGYWNISGKTNAVLVWSDLKHQGYNPHKELNGRLLNDCENVEGFFDRLSNIAKPPYRFDFLFIAKNLLRVPIEFIYKFYGFPFYLVFLFCLFRSPIKKFLYFKLLLILAFLFCLPIVNLYLENRFIYPLIPLIYFYGAYCLCWIKRCFPKPAVWIPIAAACILGQYPFTWLIEKGYSQTKADTVVQALQSKDSKPFRIACNNIAYAYYHGMNLTNIIPTILKSENDLKEYCRHCNIDYVIMDNVPGDMYEPGIIKNNYQFFDTIINLSEVDKQKTLIVLKPK